MKQSLAEDADTKVAELKSQLRNADDESERARLQAQLNSAMADSAHWHSELEALPGLARPI